MVPAQLVQIELGKEWLEHRFQSGQDVTDLFGGVACNPAERVQFVQTAAELQPGWIRQIERFLQGNGGSSSRRYQTQPISARTLYEECGLEYVSLRRNPEALLLYQQYSTFLKQGRKRTKTSCLDTISPRDPLPAYKKPDLIARLRQEQAYRAKLETQYATLLQDYVQRDVKIAELEAELARYREYFEGLRLLVQQQEHGG